MMRSKIIALALAGSGASAVVLPRGDGCCFQVTASGGKSGTVGQLGDGQNRIGGGYSPATYCINNGGITDSNGRGCILTSPTTQWQCDVGATPTTGFSISAEGEIQYNGSGKFYACGATSTEYNIYSVPVKDQKNCVEVTLSSGGECSSNGNGGGASSSSAASSVKSTVSSKATSETSTTAQASSSSMHWGPGPVSPPPSMSSETHPATTSPVKMTTSTVYTTTVSTITSCAASVTNCPAESQTTAVVTKTVAISTTVCPVTETETKPSPPATHETMMPPPATHETMPPPPATHETMPSPPATHETMAPPPATHETMPPPPATYETMPSPPATHDTMPPPPATHETMPPPPATSPNVPMTTTCAQCPPAMTVTVTVTQGCEMPTAPPAMSTPSAPPASSMPSAPPAMSMPSAPPASSMPSAPPAMSMPSAPPASSMPSAPPASSKPSAPPASSKPSAPPASSMPSAPPATSAKGGPACQTSLTGAYQTPHLIVPISSEHPDSAYGTSYNGEINSTMSSIFNFDIPQDYKGKQCSIIFLFPKKEDLETSNYDFSGSGSLGCSELSSAANQKTSWSNAPAVKSDLGSIALQPGNSYVVATQDCKAGTTQSIELSSKDGLSLNFFEDYNPSPLGLYITSC